MTIPILIPTANGETIDLHERLVSLARQNQSLDGLTPQVVLGLSNTEVARLRRNAETTNRTVSTQTPFQKETARLSLSATGRGTVESARSANAVFVRFTNSGRKSLFNSITEKISLKASEINSELKVIFIETNDLTSPLENDLGSSTDENTLIFRLKNASCYTENSNRRQAKMSKLAAEHYDLENVDDSRIIRVDGQIVAYVAGRGQNVIVVHPFVFSGSYTAASSEHRENFVKEIMELCRQKQIELYSEEFAVEEPEFSENEIEIQQREAVALLDMIPAFMEANRANNNQVSRLQRANNELASLNNNLVRYSNDLYSFSRRVFDLNLKSQIMQSDDIIVTQLEEQRSYLATTRTQISETMRAINEKKQEIIAIVAEGESISTESLTHALQEVHFIRQLGPVQAVSLVGGRNAGIKVKLYPRVIAYRNTNYILENLEFVLPFNPTSTGSISWTLFDNNSRGPRPYSPHPHVSQGGGNCFGQGDRAIRDALTRKDYSSIVTLLCGWASIYNPSSPYVRIEEFPTTSLPEGWVI